MKLPKLYIKRDGAYYFTFRGRQYYGGKTLEKAEGKIRSVVGVGVAGETDLVKLVGEYLDAIDGVQAADTVYGKSIVYKHATRRRRSPTATPPTAQHCERSLRIRSRCPC